MLTEDEVREALKKVVDPELGLDIVELGLVYGIQVQDGGKLVSVDMTLTSMGCPIGPELRAAAVRAVKGLAGVEAADVNLVFEPPWDPRTMASAVARDQLGLE